VKREVEIAKVNKANEDGRDEIEVERELYFKFIWKTRMAQISWIDENIC